MTRAVIDIGTNSVKLLVAEVSHKVVPLLDLSEQTRLGRGFYETKILQPEAIAATAKVVADFKHQAERFSPASTKVVATSAAREAKNQAEFISAIQEACGCPVQIITGDQEAEWVFLALCSYPQLHSSPLLVMDIGGGSTEFIYGENGQLLFKKSFPIGSVRLYEQLAVDDPPAPRQLAESQQWMSSFFQSNIPVELQNFLQPHPAKRIQMAATGGTATILARLKLQMPRFEVEKIDALVLSQTSVHQMTEMLWSLSLSQRQDLPFLPRKRADIILMGALIFSQAMKFFGMSEIFISTRGLRHGAVLSGA